MLEIDHKTFMAKRARDKDRWTEEFKPDVKLWTI